MKKLIDKNVLIELYVQKQLSSKDIGKELGVSPQTVLRSLRKHNLQIRDMSQSRCTEVYKSKYKHLEKNDTRTCVVCGEIFHTKSFQKTSHCSSACATKTTSAKRLARRIEVTCVHCGEKHLKIASHVDGRMQFCNAKCHGKWKSANLVGESSPSFHRIERTCSYCDAPMKIIKSRDMHEHVYCDMECMSKHYQERLLGDSNPHWKGAKHGRNVYGPTWWEARRQTLSRDENTCKLCGADDSKEALSVHHIRPFRLWEDAEKANQLDNLVALCRPCHTFVHSNENKEKVYLILE